MEEAVVFGEILTVLGVELASLAEVFVKEAEQEMEEDL